MYEDEGSSLPERPKQIHLSYSYFSVELPFDATITKRIRQFEDPVFIPVVKFEVYRWPDGGEKKFVHFGFGFEHSPGLPIVDHDVYRALKPHSGYFAKLPRASGVAVWAQGPPFAPKTTDGTPGITVPFDERAYVHAKDCKEEMYRRAERDKRRNGHGDTAGNTIPGVQDEVRQAAYRAVMAQIADDKDRAKAAKDAAFADLRYTLKQEKKHQQGYFDLSDHERAMMADLFARDGDMKNAVHFALPSAPAKPGGIVLVPR